VDEIEDLRTDLERAGIKLPPNPTILDLHRALRKDWKKRRSIEPAGIPAKTVPGPEPSISAPTAVTGASPPLEQPPDSHFDNDQKQRASELELEVLREKNRLATQTYNIENMKRKREYWASVRKGLVDPPASFQRKPTGDSTPQVQIRPRYCPIHGTTHEFWPCEEMKQAHLEAGVPLPS
jgi:hypothetical protein